MKKSITLVALLCITIFAQEKDSFVDKRDGKTYKTVNIGKQVWMAENLSYNANDSKCYDNKSENCDKYGRFYNWNTAQNVCPNGWHLPSNAEWKALVKAVGGEKTAGKHLKAASGWNDFKNISGNGLDTYGFAALPGGYFSTGEIYPEGFFGNVGTLTFWWSTSEYNVSYASSWNMHCGFENMSYKSNYKNNFYSVRCLKN